MAQWFCRFLTGSRVHCDDIPLEELGEDRLSLDDEEMLEERTHHIPSFHYLLQPIKTLTSTYPGQDVEGFRFSAGLPINQSFMITNTLNLSSKKSQAATGNALFDMMGDKTPFYSLGVQYHQLTNPDSRNPHLNYTLAGNIDANGRLHAIWAKNWGAWKLRVNSSFPNSNIAYSQTSLEIEHSGETSKQVATLSTGVLNFNLVERLGKQLMLGFDVTYVAQQNMWANGFALRYFSKASERFYAQYASMTKSVTLGTLFKVNDSTTVVTELEFGGPGASDAAVGYRTKSRNYQVDSLVKTNGEIRSTFTYSQDMMMKLKLFLSGNLGKEEFKSGFSFSVGQTDD